MMGAGLRKWLDRIFLGALLLLPVGTALVFVGIQVSSRPRFCGSCHYMEPYYQSWSTSTHRDVICVECHIPPGIRSEIRKKYEALAMVARYITGTYSTNPWAEVSDRSCLRAGCHEKRLLLGAEVYNGVLFDHQPHLAELRRSKRLRCTSCHSQIVQGSHMSVTASTCFLCHFKDTPPNSGTARCTLCHEVPEKLITAGGLSFDHGEVKRFGMECALCHRDVVKGNGEVPRERCYTCHNDEQRLSRYGETESLHRTHVTDHKIECLNCHIEIRHEVAALHEARDADCGTCHTSEAGHSAARDLYRGIGGRGVQPTPSQMYLAGITCEACHILPNGTAKVASEVSCLSCHGQKYFAIFRSWQLGISARLNGVGEMLRREESKKGTATDSEVAELLAQARFNVEFVAEGHGIHNPGYAVALLEKAFSDIRQAKEIDGGEEEIQRPWLEASLQSPCLRCHFGVEYMQLTSEGKEFSHQAHVVEAPLACTLCHGRGKGHGTMKISQAKCQECHRRIRGPIESGCLDCHEAEIGELPAGIEFPHAKHVEMGLDCAFCHQGVEGKPHLEFAKGRESLFSLGHDLCEACHADDTPPDGAGCDKCHPDF